MYVLRRKGRGAKARRGQDHYRAAGEICGGGAGLMNGSKRNRGQQKNTRLVRKGKQKATSAENTNQTGKG